MERASDGGFGGCRATSRCHLGDLYARLMDTSESTLEGNSVPVAAPMGSLLRPENERGPRGEGPPESAC